MKQMMIVLTLWFALGGSIYTYGQTVSDTLLTDEEREYVAQRGPVRMVVDPDWFPYEEVDDNGVHRGIAAELVELIAQRSGLEITLVPTSNWDESLTLAQSGGADVVSFLNQTEERSSWLIFTEPYYTDPNVLITREEHDYITNLARLTDETVVLPEGTSVEERLRKDYPNLEILIVRSEAEALQYVDSKRADMTLRSLTMAAYIIKNKGYFNLKIAGEVPSYTNYLRMGITQDDVVLQGILNKAIGTIGEAEIQTAINQYVSIQIMKGFDYKLFAVVFGVFSFVLLTSFFGLTRIRRLNRHLKERQAELVLIGEKLSVSQGLYTSILNASPDGIVLSDIEGNLLMASPAIYRILEFHQEDDLVGRNLKDFIFEEEGLDVVKNTQDLLEGEDRKLCYYNGLTLSGKQVVLEIVSEVIRNESSQPMQLVSIVRDVTDKKAVEDALRKSEAQYRMITTELESKNQLLEKIASVDALTGLQNRYAFNQRLADEIQRASRYGSKLSLLVMDLDLFKRINDTYGHDAGDQVLRTISNMLQHKTRSVDLVARWGGEEFVVLMPGLELSEGVIVGEKLRLEAERLIHINNETVTISIGVSEWTYKDSVESWFRRTDMALYHAKQEGRNRVCISEGPELANDQLLVWDPAWNSGHQIIDHQHQGLLTEGNALIALAMQSTERLLMMPKLMAVIQHIQKHFEYEEGVLRQYNYEALDQHIQKHRELIIKAENLAQKSSEGKLLPTDVVRFIVGDIVTMHLIEEDTKFFTLFKS